MVASVPANRTEIVGVASGKGGTGKTIILASLGYALQTSGHRVLFIDSDTATDGLSLFLLGPRGWEAISEVDSRNILSEYLRRFEYLRLFQDKTNWQASVREVDVAGFKVNRGRQDDHGQIYELVLSGRGLYGDVKQEIDQSAVPQLIREQYRDAIQLLFDSIRRANQWDYVLVDTRGGFGFNTTDVCALSDSFFLVTEADYTSFYQDKNLVHRISAAASKFGRKPVMRGVIVNKATEVSTNGLEASLGIHELNLDKVEANFRSILVEAFSIRYSDTHPIPLDVEAVNAYKSQKVPYIECPGSVFSYATMVAFSNLMRTVVVRWSEETTLRWNGLVDRVSEAIRSENERKLSLVNRQHTLERERERLDQENRLLKEQIDELKKTFDRSEALAKSTTGRLRERALLLAVPIFLTLGIMALFISFRTLDKGSVAQLAQYQEQKELEQIRQQVLVQQQKALDQRQQVEMLLRQIEQRLAPQAPAPQGLQPQQRQPEQPQQQTPADETPRKQ